MTQAQIAAAHWDTSKPGLPLFRQLVNERVAEAMKGRAEIQAAPDDTARAIQEARHRSLEVRLTRNPHHGRRGHRGVLCRGQAEGARVEAAGGGEPDHRQHEAGLVEARH